MNLQGEVRIPARRERVWEALNDPLILAECIPGVQEINKTSDTDFTAKVRIAVGPVKATFNGSVTLAELDPPSAYKIHGRGEGGIAGFAQGSASVRLTALPDSTQLNYEVHAQIGGKVAQIGSRLITGVAKKYAEEFFLKLGAKLGNSSNDPRTSK